MFILHFIKLCSLEGFTPAGCPDLLIKDKEKQVCTQCKQSPQTQQILA